MKLSSAYLSKTISEYSNILKQNRISGKDTYLRPVFLCLEKDGTVLVSPEKIKEHVVILDGWTEELKAQLKGLDVFCICAGFEMEEDWKGAYLVLEEQRAGVIFNLLTEIFDVCDAWTNKLQRVLMANGGINRILKVGTDFMGNPLTVMGQDFTFVADAGTEGLADHQQIFIEENVNVPYMNEMIQYKTLERELHWPVIYPAFLGGCRTIGVDLHMGEKVTHKLILSEARKPIGEEDFCFLSELTEYIEYALSHIPAILEKSGLEDIFLTALTDRKADYLQVSRKLNQLGWGSKHEYSCLVLQILYEEESAMTIHGIRRHMKKQFPDSCSFEYEGFIVTFFNLTKLGMSEDEVGSSLTYFIRDSYLKAGYSRVVRGHMGIRRQFLQAKISLDVGSRVKPYVWIYRFNQIVMPYILEQTTHTLPGRMLCHEGVLELMRMDDEYHTQYIQTLRSYLDNQLNATKTANDLFIHRSTFLYRLEKIKEILQSTLDDPDELFYLNYSLRLLEQE